MIRELIERLESATKPSSALNKEICDLVFDIEWRPYSTSRRVRTHWGYKRGTDDVVFYGIDRIPRYTASIDEALTLVPEEWEAILYTETPQAEMYPTSGVKRPAGIKFRDVGANLAIALCIAALKAREAKP